MTILLLRLLLSFVVSFEKIYQTLETVFHWLSKHREFRQMYSAARHIFTLSSRCLDIPMKHCLSCLIYYFNISSSPLEHRYLRWNSSFYFFSKVYKNVCFVTDHWALNKFRLLTVPLANRCCIQWWHWCVSDTPVISLIWKWFWQGKMCKQSLENRLDRKYFNNIRKSRSDVGIKGALWWAWLRKVKT